MKLSILDQAPISPDNTAQEALVQAKELALIGEKLGYTRYWIAEHHDLAGLACPAPEVMLGYIGAHTNSIRLGAGAILLPHYKPYKVAETFHLLATLFPNRIDLGIGRAPGGSAEASMALSNNFLEEVRKMPEKVKELLQFLYEGFPDNHPFAKVSAAPVPAIAPEPWILGTGEKSSNMAAENGTSYAFGLFMSDKEGTDIINRYKNNFKASMNLESPQTILAVSVICAETNEKAEKIAFQSFLWREQLNQLPGLKNEQSQMKDFNETIGILREKVIIGNPQVVCEELKKLQSKYEVDEIMIVTITEKVEDRFSSYKLIASEMWNS